MSFPAKIMGALTVGAPLLLAAGLAQAAGTMTVPVQLAQAQPQVQPQDGTGNLSPEEIAKRKAEALKKAQDLAKQKVQQQEQLKAQGDAKAKAQDQEKQKAQEQAKQKAQSDAKAQAQELEKQKAQEQGKQKADALAKDKAQEIEKLKADDLAKQKAQELAKQKPKDQTNGPGKNPASANAPAVTPVTPNAATPGNPQAPLGKSAIAPLAPANPAPANPAAPANPSPAQPQGAQNPGAATPLKPAIGAVPAPLAPAAPALVAPGTAAAPAAPQQPAQLAPPPAATALPGAVAGAPPPPLAKLGAPVGHLQDLTQGRQKHTEDNGARTVIQEPGNRTIIVQNNTTIINHDDAPRFAVGATASHAEKRPDGTTVNIFVRPGGIQIFNVTAPDGGLVRRYRRDPDGHEFNLIDNRDVLRAGLAIGAGALIAAAIIDLPPPHYDLPPERYAVDYGQASDDVLSETLEAPPVERLDRHYSLNQVLYTYELRERMRHIDLDTLTFASASWDVDPQEYPQLERIANLIKRIVLRRPGEVFLIEGHTDAVGSAIDNLSLSDRRAEEVARVMSEVFGVPPENMVTQGYGKQFLKVPTGGAERANRRVVIRRITPLMADAR